MVRFGVLSLQGDFREHGAVIAATGAEPVPVRLPADLERIDALAIPGGESTTIGRLADRYGLVEPLRRVIEAGLPTLGTCAGMIFLARGTTAEKSQIQLGVLDVVVRRNAFGPQVASFETDLDVAGIAEPVRGVFIRAPWIDSVGPDVEVLAEVDGHPVMVRQGAILATSFHPELTGDTRIHRLLLPIRGRA